MNRILGLLLTVTLVVWGCAMFGSWKSIPPPGGCDQCHTLPISTTGRSAYKPATLNDETGRTPWQQPESCLPPETSPLEEKKVTEQRCFRCHKGPGQGPHGVPGALSPLKALRPSVLPLVPPPPGGSVSVCVREMPMFRRTKIVATVGPACESEGGLLALMEAGADVFRLNFSHGDLESKSRADPAHPRPLPPPAAGGGDPRRPAGAEDPHRH